MNNPKECLLFKHVKSTETGQIFQWKHLHLALSGSISQPTQVTIDEAFDSECYGIPLAIFLFRCNCFVCYAWVNVFSCIRWKIEILISGKKIFAFEPENRSQNYDIHYTVCYRPYCFSHDVSINIYRHRELSYCINLWNSIFQLFEPAHICLV